MLHPLQSAPDAPAIPRDTSSGQYLMLLGLERLKSAAVAAGERCLLQRGEPLGEFFDQVVLPAYGYPRSGVAGVNDQLGEIVNTVSARGLPQPQSGHVPNAVAFDAHRIVATRHSYLDRLALPVHRRNQVSLNHEARDQRFREPNVHTDSTQVLGGASGSSRASSAPTLANSSSVLSSEHIVPLDWSRRQSRPVVSRPVRTWRSVGTVRRTRAPIVLMSLTTRVGPGPV